MAEDSTQAFGTLPKSPGVKIIPAAQEQAWRDGFHYLTEVRRIYAAERAKGYAEGRAAAARDAGVLILETKGKVDRYFASVESELVSLAFDIVSRVLGEFDDAELVSRAARTALADFREEKAVTIRVHPSAEVHVRQALSDLLVGADGSPMITVEADPRMEPRGCVLSTDIAIVDASIETQLAAIAEAMKRRDQGGAA
jgi:type III secretion protein L